MCMCIIVYVYKMTHTHTRLFRQKHYEQQWQSHRWKVSDDELKLNFLTCYTWDPKAECAESYHLWVFHVNGNIHVFICMHVYIIYIRIYL